MTIYACIGACTLDCLPPYLAPMQATFLVKEKFNTYFKVSNSIYLIPVQPQFKYLFNLE